MKEHREVSTTLSGVERTVRILKAVEAAGATNLADIARRAGLNEATALRYLNSLSNLGFIERFDSTQYRLGWEVFRMGQHAISTGCRATPSVRRWRTCWRSSTRRSTSR